MKKLLQVILIQAFIFLFTLPLRGQVTAIATGGASSGNYTTLKAAFDAINAGTHTGIIELLITANTTETASASLDSSGNGFSNYTSIVIRPINGLTYTISGNIAGSMVNLNGADGVTINGQNTGGNGLIFENTNVGASNTIRLINDASRNVITNCTILGASNAITNANVLFSTGTSGGNDSNTVSFCSFGGSGANLPTNSILSIGSTTVGLENSNGIITNNNIANFFSATLVSTGINLGAGNTNWQISNNKLYQTASRIFTTANYHKGIQVISGSNYQINNNIIGAADSTTTGMYIMGGTVATTFAGVFLTSVAGGNNTIINNTITKFNFSTTSTASTVNGVFAGISVTAGNATIINNVIGDTIGTASIIVSAGSAGALMGIHSASTGNITIQGNYWGALQNIGATATVIASIHCINISAAATTLTMRSNTIGNNSADNIVAGTLGVTTVNTLVSGVNQPSTSTNIIFANNVVRNLSSFGSGTGAYARGYFTALSNTLASVARVDSNTVFNLKCNGATAGVASAVSVVNGIQYLASNNGSISNNVIYNLFALNTGAVNTCVSGISIGSAANMLISNNRIYGFNNASTATSATAPGVIAGITLRSATTVVKVYNNFISLGLGVTGNVSVIGIWGNHGSTPNPIDSIAFNSIYIGGTQASGAQPSFGFYRGDFSVTARAIVVDLEGNIFQNMRTGGTGKHYAMSNNFGATTPSTTGWAANASNFNNLYGSDSNAIVSFGATNHTLNSWRTFSSCDNNSISKTVLMADTTIADLHLSGVSQTDPTLNCAYLTAVPLDVDGQLRNTGQTQMGADEFVQVCVAPPVAGAATVASPNVCANTPFTVSLAGAGSGLGTSYQWELSANGLVGPFSAITNATNFQLNTSQTTTSAYRCVVTCSNQSSISAPVLVSTNSTPLPPTITIDTALAQSASNFHSLATLVNELNCRGIAAPTTVTVAPYNRTFAGNFTFTNIPGASSTNTITFLGNGNTISSNLSPIVSFNNASYIILDSFNITGGSGFAGTGVYVTGASHHLTFNRNVINVGTTSTATTNIGFAASGSATGATTVGNNAQYITFTNNQVIGGYYSFCLIGNASYLNNHGHYIANNTFKDFYIYGVYLSNADTVTFINNDINRATRGTVTTLYGIYLATSRNLKIQGNRLHDFGNASYTAYPMYITNCVNSVGYETEVSNNMIYNVGTTGVMYGIYSLTTAISGFNFYHNTIQHDVPATSASAIRGAFFSVAITNVNFKNNIINITGGGTGVKTGIYVTTASTSFSSNNNVIRVATTASNNVGFWATANVTLADWLTASGQDANSVTFNPVFSNAAAGNLTPLSSNIDNIGVPLGITTDINGAVRSTTTPDIGAYEFTGIAGDIAITNGVIKRSSVCYSNADTVQIGFTNLIGQTVDFTINPLTITWNITGPVNSSGNIVVNSDTLAVNGLRSVFVNTADLSQPGTYTLRAYLQPNTVNTSATNDTLGTSFSLIVQPILSVTQRNFTVTSPTDTVVLKAKSPIFPGGSLFFSEVCHWKLATGAAPVGGWPAYLIADDYVEISGVPNSDLAGFVLEEWTGTALQHSVTFPTNTLFSPAGTMIIATGQLGTSAPSPANFYYHSGNTVTHSSTGDLRGYVIKNSSGTVIDAVTYGAYTFPVASGVTVNDWSGSTPAASSAGNRLTSADNNTGSNWITENAAARQDPNIINPNVPLPSPTSLTGFTWNYLGSPIDTTVNKKVGPWTTPGVYQYVAQYITACGTFYDTVFVTATSTVPVKLLSFTATKTNADVLLTWSTASEKNVNYFEVFASTDGKNFNRLEQVKATGNSEIKQTYAYLDAQALNTSAKQLYYKLNMVDMDGSSAWSNTAIVDVDGIGAENLVVYPNPFDNNLSLKVTDPADVIVEITTLAGVRVFNQTYNNHNGNIEINSLNINSGMYIISTTQNGVRTTQKLVKQ